MKLTNSFTGKTPGICSCEIIKTFEATVLVHHTALELIGWLIGVYLWSTTGGVESSALLFDASIDWLIDRCVFMINNWWGRIVCSFLWRFSSGTVARSRMHILLYRVVMRGLIDNPPEGRHENESRRKSIKAGARAAAVAYFLTLPCGSRRFQDADFFSRKAK